METDIYFFLPVDILRIFPVLKIIRRPVAGLLLKILESRHRFLVSDYIKKQTQEMGKLCFLIIFTWTGAKKEKEKKGFVLDN